MSDDRWHLITGEYPPSPGGVGDYTALLAAALADSGAEAHVWTSRVPSSDQEGLARRLTVHTPVGGWSGPDLRCLDAELDAFAPPRRLVVQYTPNVWGYKGLNLGFCRWLVRRKRRGDDVRVMFHEVWYPLQLRDKPTRWLLALGHRLMARSLMDACSSAYVSIPAWEPLLRSSERGPRRPITWLPVPSNIPVVDDAAAVAALRGQLAPRGETIVGSFGTFGGMIADMLAETLILLSRSRTDRVVLFGRGSEPFAARLIERCPELAGRVVAAGGLPPAEVSVHLQACDLLVQPYPDGLSSRRGSLMAGLAHGVATVSNLGALSEPIWTQAGGVALAPEPSPAALAATAEPLIACPERRTELGALAREVYRTHFAVERTVEAMTGGTKTLVGQVSTCRLHRLDEGRKTAG